MKKYSWEAIDKANKVTYDLPNTQPVPTTTYKSQDFIDIFGDKKTYKTSFELSRLLRDGYCKKDEFIQAIHILETLKEEGHISNEEQNLIKDILKRTRKTGKFVEVIGTFLMKNIISKEHIHLIKIYGKSNDNIFLGSEENYKYRQKFLEANKGYTPIGPSNRSHIKSPEKVINTYKKKIHTTKILTEQDILPVHEFHDHRKDLREILIVHGFFDMQQQLLKKKRKIKQKHIINRHAYILLGKIVHQMGKLHDTAIKTQHYDEQYIELPKELKTLLGIYFEWNDR